MKHKDIYKSLSDHYSNGVYSLYTEGRFRSFNPAAEHITGFQSEDLIGHSFAPLIEPVDLAKTQNYFHRVLSGDSCHLETTIRTASGQPVFLHVINLPIIVNGSISGVFGIAEDVTKNRRT